MASSNSLRLGDLPAELLQCIAQLCDREDASALARTCHKFHIVINALIYSHHVRGPYAAEGCLFWAAQHGRLETMKRAHEYGLDLFYDGLLCESVTKYKTRLTEYFAETSDDTPLVMPSTALHQAVAHNQDHIVKFILEHGDDIQTKLSQPTTGVCSCSNPVHKNQRKPFLGPQSASPLHLAMRHNKDEKIAAMLIEQGAYPRGDPDREGGDPDRSAIFCAIQLAKLKVVDLLIRHPMCKPTDLSQHRYTALHAAADCGDEEFAELVIPKLVAWGVPIDQLSDVGTALRVAIHDANHGTALCLLAQGANVSPIAAETAGFSGPNLLYMTIFDEHDKTRPWTTPNMRSMLLSTLIAKGLDFETPVRRHGDWCCSVSLLLLAAYTCDLACMDVLLGVGAQADATLVMGEDVQIVFSVSLPVALPIGKPITLIMALLIHRRLPDDDQSENEVDDDDGPMANVICLLLRHGARVDSVKDELSALEYSYLLASQGEWKTEQLFADNATEKNLAIDHVQHYVDKYFKLREEVVYSSVSQGLQLLTDSDFDSLYTKVLDLTALLRILLSLKEKLT